MTHWKATIIVVILAVAGVIAIVATERRESGAESGPGGSGPLLTESRLPVDDVTRITVRRGDDAPLVFERTVVGWSQLEPFPHPMDPFSIRRLAADARAVTAADSVDPASVRGGLAALGLDPPQAVVEYEWPSGSLRLRFGRRGVAGRAYLVIAGEDRVWVVDQVLHDRAVEMDPREWRDRRLFHHAGIESSSIGWTAANDGFELVRTRRQWSMISPVATRADPSACEELFDALGRAKGDGFILDQPDDLGAFGLVDPVATLTVVTSGREERADGGVETVEYVERLRIGAPVGAGSQDRFGLVDGRPTVVRVPAAAMASLFLPPVDVIDPTGSGARPADVKSIRIATGETELRLERDLERWVAPDYDGRAVPREVVDRLLEQLCELRAPLVRMQPFPYELQVATITLHGFDSRPMDTVRLAKDPETGRWAMENGDNVLRVFPESLEIELATSDFGLQ